MHATIPVLTPDEFLSKTSQSFRVTTHHRLLRVTQIIIFKLRKSPAYYLTEALPTTKLRTCEIQKTLKYTIMATTLSFNNDDKIVNAILEMIRLQKI